MTITGAIYQDKYFIKNGNNQFKVMQNYVSLMIKINIHT